MAFTFQNNQSEKFLHDSYLLKKADQYKPALHYAVVNPTGIVNLQEDHMKLMGWGTQKVSLSINELSRHPMQKGDQIILDFGTHIVGHLHLSLDTVGSPMDAPLHLKLRFAEVPAELVFKTEDYHGWLSSSWIQEDVIHLDELPAELNPDRRYSFRYVEITVLDTSPKWQLIIRNAYAVSESSCNQAGFKPMHFEDEQLQKIYDVSLKTLSECMQDVFEDGPKRDRRLWLGDLRLQALTDYASYDQVDLVKRCLYLFAGMRSEAGRIPANVFVKPKYVPDDTFLFDYSMFFISVLYDLEAAHEDAVLLKDLYPACREQAEYSFRYVNEDGRFTMDEKYPLFIDWSNEYDKTTCGQAVMIYVLKQFVTLAEKMEDPELQKYQNRLDAMIRYARDSLLDAESGMFVSGEKKEINLASQVWMVLAGILSQKENKTLMEKTIKRFFPIRGVATPYMYHHVAEALFLAGLKEEAVDLIRSYWGKMIDLGADTYYEAFMPEKPDFSPYGSPIVSSFCHAWACTPVYLLKKYL